VFLHSHHCYNNLLLLMYPTCINRIWPPFKHNDLTCQEEKLTFFQHVSIYAIFLKFWKKSKNTGMLNYTFHFCEPSSKYMHNQTLHCSVQEQGAETWKDRETHYFNMIVHSTWLLTSRKRWKRHLKYFLPG
jgi:hypothetical protein